MTGARRSADRPGAGGPEDGAGTVLALGLVLVLATLVIGCAAVGAAVAARHRAATAADLSALAAADRSLGRAGGAPCAAAGSVAGANGADLTACAVEDDGSVSVAVSVGLPRPWHGLGTATARARAGRPPP